MGSNGSPQRLQVAPSSPSRPTRLVSAMPSSRCWPSGRSRQCRMVSGSSANQSTRSRADHTPTLFTQPPRLVDDETSGASVTTRFAASGAVRVRSSRVRPSAAWVVACPPGVAADVGGQLGHGVRRDGRAAEAIGGVAAQRRGGRRCREAGPGLVGGRADLLGQLAPLLGGEQRGVVLRVALRGQAVALDRVREEHGRAGVVDGFERLAQGGRGRGRRGCGSRRTGWRRRARTPARRAWSSSPGTRSRSWSGVQRSRRWYSGFSISSIRRRSASPPGRSYSSCSSRPYLTVSTCQPAASNMPARRTAPMLGTIRSRLCRLRSMIQHTSPRSCTIGSRIASQQAPSSSSASPTIEYWRPVPART